MAEPDFVAVARASDIAPESAREVTVNGCALLLVHSDGEFFAVENLCSHAHEPLACGRVKRGWISCPAHGARFDLASGEPLGAPATEPIRIFPLRMADGMIEVAV